ncbi:nucleobase:cation symporter-2 family protein [Xanthomonas massiliensis]|uniref:nucleobase:cation symporter-2 family protein n=1 Tax=Xanthomonas massiliensis TaxID=1720302 RepID=UPI000825D970|nr:nucleobase:cation symporter-2 family protein [Xanthomonas massiliensis]
MSSVPFDAVEHRPPAARLGLLALQHVLVMYAGAVAVPLIVASALGLARADTAFLISADLFCCGLATLVQSVGLPGLGIRLPVVMGATFAAVGPMIAVAGAPHLGLPYVFGAYLVAGAAGVLAAPWIGRLLRLFPPVVTGTVVAAIGLTLLAVAIDWAAGGATAPDYGAPRHLGIAALVLLAVLALLRHARGFVANISVLLGLVLGMAVAAAAGQVDLAGLAQAAWLAPVRPFHFGLPRFDLWACLTMCVVLFIVFVESTGMFLALGELVERPVDRPALVRGLRVDGLGMMLGGVFNAFPDTSYSQNIGLVGLTGVRSRWVCALAGALLVLLGLIPKLGVLAAAIPPSVLGGAGLVMFGMVAANGIRTLARVDFAGDRRHNLVIVAVSLALALVPTASPHFFDHLPAALAPLLHSGILLATVAAVALNLWFNGLGDPPRQPR